MPKRPYNLQMRLLPSEIAAFRAASEALGLSVSAWARSRLLHATQIQTVQFERERPDAREESFEASRPA